MSINTSTLFWAVINFIVLCIILKVFLYKPVCKILDERKATVLNNMEQAESAKVEAERLKNEYAEQLKNAKNEAQEIVNKANQMGEQTKASIVAEAREEAAKLTQKAQEEINREKSEAINELRGEVANLAVLAAEKIIGKSIDAKDHEAMVNDFVKEVGDAK